MRLIRIRNCRLRSLIVIAMLAMVIPVTKAQVPHTISYQGMIRSGSTALSGQHLIHVTLYDNLVGGNMVYEESHQTTMTDGVFSILIGSVTAFPEVLRFDKPYYLSISIDGAAELTSRTPLASAPYALNSHFAELASGLTNDAHGVVTSINEVSGAVRLIGDSTTIITQSGNDIMVHSKASVSGGVGIQSVASPDNTIVILNPKGPNVSVGVADNAITTSKIKDGAVTPAKLNQGGATNGQVLKWNGTSWVPSNDLSTTYTAGNGITINGSSIAVSSPLPPGTVTHSTLRYNGTSWVENTNLLSTATGLTTVNNNLLLGNLGPASELHFYEPSPSGNNYSSFAAQTQSADILYVLPANPPSLNQTLAASSVSGAGPYIITLGWQNPGGSNWLLSGNAGTIPGTNFLGTTDNQGFVLKTNNTEAMRISATGYVGIGTPGPIQKLSVENGNILLSRTGTNASGQIQLQGNGTGLSTLSAGAQGTTNINYTLPTSQPTIGQVLSATAITGAGPYAVTLGWANGGGNAWNLTGNSGTTFGTNFIGTTDNVDLQFRVNNGQAGLIQVSNQTANTGFGYGVLSHNNTGANNTGIGFGALNSSDGSFNTAGGCWSLNSNVTGSFNTSYGARALQSSTDGSYNTAVGERALANNGSANSNTAIGFFALYNNITGTGNTSNGYYVLSHNTTGNYNTAFGDSALLVNTTGSINTALGHLANVSTNNLTNATSIGANATVAQSNSMVLGSINGVNNAASDVKVGIGTTTPLQKFNVENGNILLSRTGSNGADSLSFQGTGTGISSIAAGAQGTTNINYILPTSQPTTNQILSATTISGTGPYAVTLGWVDAGSGNAWNLTGNGGTTAGTNFLGTIDNQALDLRSNNILRLRLNTNNSIQRDNAGNARGIEAMDFQVSRNTNAMIASGDYSVILGGTWNTASGPLSAIIGGTNNVASNNEAIAGGYSNSATGVRSVAIGGEANLASGTHSISSGGTGNTAGGESTAILGGAELSLTGDYVFGFNSFSGGSSTMIIGTSNVAVFGNVDIWLANTRNAATQLKFFEAQSSNGAFPAAGTNFSSFQAGSQTTDITYTLPTSQPTTNQVLSATAITGAGPYAVTLGWVNGGSSNAWNLTGNSGTTSGTNFLGTTDNHAFEIHVFDGDASNKGSKRVMRFEPNATSANIVGGSPANTVTSGVVGAVLSGGGSAASGNSVTDDYGIIVGGTGNSVGDGAGTTSDAGYAFVGDGFGNHAKAYSSLVVGGFNNSALGSYSAVVGGNDNVADTEGSFIGGGNDNRAYGWQSSIVGGQENRDSGSYGFIGAGLSNFIFTGANYAVIGGGSGDSVVSQFGTVGGGYNNTVRGSEGTIGGGENNTVSGDYSVIAGGHGNSTSGTNSGVLGGITNVVTSAKSSIAGGESNYIEEEDGFIGSGFGNAIIGTSKAYGVILGGYRDTVLGNYSAILGGEYLKLGDNSLGFTQSTSTTSTDLTAMNHIAYFGNVNMMIGNTDNTSRQLQFYAPNSVFNYSTSKYSSFAAGSQSTTINYTLPSSQPTTNQVLAATAISGTGPYAVTLGWADQFNGSGFVSYGPTSVQATLTPRTTPLFNIAYISTAASANAAGATITSSAGTGGNLSATGLTVKAIATGTGLARAIEATGRVNIDSVSSYDIKGDQWLWRGPTADPSVTMVGNTQSNSNTGTYNVFIGWLTGTANTTGQENTFVGTQTGISNTTGSYNSFYGGYGTAGHNTTGSYNSYFGGSVGVLNSTGSKNSFFGTSTGINETGSDNSFFGFAAGASATTAVWNTFAGEQAGFSLTTGSYNTHLGGYSGYYNYTGSHNTYIGYKSGMIASGSNNTFIGDSSGCSNTGSTTNSSLLGSGSIILGTISNAAAIGALAEVTAANSLVLGSINGINSATSDVNVGIGTTSPLQKFNVENGNILLSRIGTNGADSLKFQGTGTGVSSIAAGAQSTTNINYTLPVSAPVANGNLLLATSGTSSSWSWSTGLVWDNTNSRLGINITTPSHPVHSVNSGTTDEIAAVYGNSTGSTTSQAIGIWGDASNTGTSNTGTIGVLATGNGNATAGQTNIALQINDGEFTMGRTSEAPATGTDVQAAAGGTAYSAQGPSGVVELTLGGAGDLVTAAPTANAIQKLTTITINNRYCQAGSIVLLNIVGITDDGNAPDPRDAAFILNVDNTASGSFSVRVKMIPAVTSAVNYAINDKIQIGYVIVNKSK